MNEDELFGISEKTREMLRLFYAPAINDLEKSFDMKFKWSFNS